MRSDWGEIIGENHIPHKSFPGITQALWIMLISIVVVIPTSLIIGILVWLLNIESSNGFATYLTYHIACFITVIYFYMRYIKLPFNEVFFLNRFPIKIILPMLVTILGLGIILSDIDNLFRLIFPMPTFLQDFSMQYMFNQEHIILIIITSIVLGPIIEELMFRGLLLHGFLGRYRLFNAIILSSLFFALIHLNPWQFFGAFVTGCFLGWILVNTHSLYPCIIGHAFFNSLSKIIYYTKIRIPGLLFEGITTPHVFQPLWLDLCGVLLIIMGIMILFKQLGTRHN